MRTSSIATGLLAVLLALAPGSCGAPEPGGGDADEASDAAVELEAEGADGAEKPAAGEHAAEEGQAEDQEAEEPEQPTAVAESQPESQPQPAEQTPRQPSEEEQKHLAATCFVSWSGESYHENPTCDALGGDHNLIDMTIGEAIDAGYEPCDYCTY